MLLGPRVLKYKKSQKGKTFNRIQNIIKFQSIKFDKMKLIALSHGRITAKQINSISSILNKYLKRIGLVKFNLFPHTPISKKPIEVRMGKGKGSVDHYVFNVKVGFTICEIQTSFKIKAYHAIKMAQIRLPLKTKILTF